MGYYRRLAPTIDIVANFGFRHADDGAHPTRAPGARHIAAAGRKDAAKSDPVAAIGAMVRGALTRLLAVDF